MKIAWRVTYLKVTNGSVNWTLSPTVRTSLPMEHSTIVDAAKWALLTCGHDEVVGSIERCEVIDEDDPGYAAMSDTRGD